MKYRWIILVFLIGFFGLKMFKKNGIDSINQIDLNDPSNKEKVFYSEIKDNSIEESNIHKESFVGKEGKLSGSNRQEYEDSKKTFYPETLDAIREEFKSIPLNQREEQIKALRENNAEFKNEIGFLNELKSLPYTGPKPPEPEEDLSNDIDNE